MRFADCHPDRKHYAKGFCEACYAVNRRKNDSTIAANIVPACMSCNIRKGTMTKEEFLNVLLNSAA